MAAAMFLTTRAMPPTALGSRQATSVRLPKRAQMPALKAQGRRAARVCKATAATEPTHGNGRPGERKGFVEEMRIVAMKLHTRQQAPKEGQAEAREEQQEGMQTWEPTLENYLQFLVESKVMYEALEVIVAEAKHESYKSFQNTGLERVAALEKDIAWFNQQYKGMKPRALKSDGPGETYATLLKQLAAEDAPAFICHFYNVYFAHSAGGRMIGTKMSEMLLDGHKLNFYGYGDHVLGSDPSYMKELLQVVKDSLDVVAEGWTREQKEHCLEETAVSFKMSGAVLRTLFLEKKVMDEEAE